MGVKYFFAWLRNNFPDRIKSLMGNNFNTDIDNLMIDLNGIFHNCAQSVYRYGELKSLLSRPKHPTLKQQIQTYDKIWEEIRKIVKLSKPRKKLILCIDGVAPLAKQIQQRQRRFKSVRDKNLDEFDSNCITPGTKFMDYLSKNIDFKIKNEMMTNPIWQSLEVVFSNEKVPGEGEHKLINFIRQYGGDDESFCVHGMDADLVMLSLATHKDNFHILRENHRNRNEIFHINLQGLREDICRQLGWRDDCDNQNLIDDFVFMLFSVGNDFLPNLPAMDILENGIEILFETYRTNASKYGYLTTRNQEGVYFNPKSFSEFLGVLGKYEEDILTRKANMRGTYFTDDLLERHSTLVEGKYVIDFQKYKTEYYTTHLSKSLEETCNLYLEGLQWVLTYYTKGVPHWNWVFPCYYTVFSSDLSKYVVDYGHKKYEQSYPLQPFQQLLCVLPQYSKKLLPPPLDSLLENNSPLKKYYPHDFVIDLQGKRNQWEGIAILPIIDVETVNVHYNKLIKQVESKEVRRNQVGHSFTYKYNPNINYTYHSFYGDIKNCSISTDYIIL